MGLSLFVTLERKLNNSWRINVSFFTFSLSEQDPQILLDRALQENKLLFPLEIKSYFSYPSTALCIKVFTLKTLKTFPDRLFNSISMLLKNCFLLLEPKCKKFSRDSFPLRYGAALPFSVFYSFPHPPWKVFYLETCQEPLRELWID